jgi:hypothetical protein
LATMLHSLWFILTLVSYLNAFVEPGAYCVASAYYSQTLAVELKDKS